MRKEYYVYIMASHFFVLYIGVTNNVYRRVSEHKNNVVEGFSKKYNCHKLVYVENYSDIRDAIKREKQLKKWSRNKKMALIRKVNPSFRDLFIDI